MGTEKITLSEAMNTIKNDFADEYKKINVLLLTVFHMMQISDKILAEIEDILESHHNYRFDIKRKHKIIAKQIHEEYMPLFNRLHGSDLGNMYVDNVELEEVIKVWAGVIKGKKVELTDIPTEGEAMTIQKHKVTSDYLLRNGDGWTMTVPKAMHDTCVKMSRELKEELNDNLPHPVGVKIWVGKEKEEEPINND